MAATANGTATVMWRTEAHSGGKWRDDGSGLRFNPSLTIDHLYAAVTFRLCRTKKSPDSSPPGRVDTVQHWVLTLLYRQQSYRRIYTHTHTCSFRRTTQPPHSQRKKNSDRHKIKSKQISKYKNTVYLNTQKKQNCYCTSAKNRNSFKIMANNLHLIK